MAKLVPENIQTLLSTFKFDVDDDCINEDLTCTICKKLLHDVYQSTCECKYCHKCIVSYINDNNDYCPGGKDACREDLLVLGESVFPNPVLYKKVLKVRIRCPNESCQFASTLIQMEDHLRVCNHQPMECPYTKIGCANVRVKRDSVETHLNKDMLVHSQMLMEVVDNLKNEVGFLKEALRANKLEMTSLQEECKLKQREIREDERRMGQEERETLAAGLEELKGAVAALRGQLEWTEENQQRLKKLEEVVMELRGDIEIERKESRKLSGEIDTLNKELGTKIEELRKMIGEIDAFKKEVEIERKESRKMIGEFDSLKKEVEIETKESRKMSGEIDTLKKEVEIERKESRKMSGEIETLKKEVEIERKESRKMSGEIDTLKKEMGTKREESKKMRGDIEVLQGDVKRIDDVTGRKKKTEVPEAPAGNDAT